MEAAGTGCASNFTMMRQLKLQILHTSISANIKDLVTLYLARAWRLCSQNSNSLIILLFIIFHANSE